MNQSLEGQNLLVNVKGVAWFDIGLVETLANTLNNEPPTTPPSLKIVKTCKIFQISSLYGWTGAGDCYKAEHPALESPP